MPTSSPISTQLTLASLTDNQGWELLSIDDDRKGNRCTAACLDARLELREAILRALAEETLGSRRIAEAFGVSREVVRALRKATLKSGELGHTKEAIAQEAFSLARLTIDRIRDELDEMPRSSLAIVAGVMIDKGQLLSGGPTSITEQKRGESVSDIKAYIDSLPVAEPVVTGDETGQKGSALEGGSEAGAVVDLAPAGERVADQAGDSLSPVLRADTEEGAR